MDIKDLHLHHPAIPLEAVLELHPRYYVEALGGDADARRQLAERLGLTGTASRRYTVATVWIQRGRIPLDLAYKHRNELRKIIVQGVTQGRIGRECFEVVPGHA